MFHFLTSFSNLLRKKVWMSFSCYIFIIISYRWFYPNKFPLSVKGKITFDNIWNPSIFNLEQQPLIYLVSIAAISREEKCVPVALIPILSLLRCKESSRVRNSSRWFSSWFSWTQGGVVNVHQKLPFFVINAFEAKNKKIARCKILCFGGGIRTCNLWMLRETRWPVVLKKMKKKCLQV